MNPKFKKTPAAQLASFMAKYDPSIQRIVRAARSKLRKMLPRAVELVYDNYNALAIGFGPTERASDAIVSLTVYPRWVNLYFLHGATLPDPGNLLRGNGKQGRYLTLENASDLDTPKVRALLKASIVRARVPIPRVGGGYTLIKSVSARQRPRRANPRSKDGAERKH